MRHAVPFILFTALAAGACAPDPEVARRACRDIGDIPFTLERRAHTAMAGITDAELILSRYEELLALLVDWSAAEAPPPAALMDSIIDDLEGAFVLWIEGDAVSATDALLDLSERVQPHVWWWEGTCRIPLPQSIEECRAGARLRRAAGRAALHIARGASAATLPVAALEDPDLHPAHALTVRGAHANAVDLAAAGDAYSGGVQMLSDVDIGLDLAGCPLSATAP